MKLELPSHDGPPVLNLSGVTVPSLGVPIPFTLGITTSIDVVFGGTLLEPKSNVVPLTVY